ncbi:MAG: InlB B-repeat-containing protein [Clostridia bacterium]
MQLFKHKKRLSIVAAVLAALLIVPIGMALAADGEDGLYINGQYVADGETIEIQDTSSILLKYYEDGKALTPVSEYVATADRLADAPTMQFRADSADPSAYAAAFVTVDGYEGQTFTYTVKIRERPENIIASTVSLKLTITGQEKVLAHSVTVDPNIEHGSISLNGTYDKVMPNNVVRYIIKPDEGYQLVPGSCKVDDQVLTTGLNKFFSMPDHDVVLTAEFSRITPEVEDGATVNGTHVDNYGTCTVNVDPGSLSEITVAYIVDGAPVDLDGDRYSMGASVMRDEGGTQRLPNPWTGDAGKIYAGFTEKDAGKTYEMTVLINDEEKTSGSKNICQITIQYVVSNNPTGVKSTMDFTNFKGMENASITSLSATGWVTKEDILGGEEICPGSVVTVTYSTASGYYRNPDALKILDSKGDPVELNTRKNDAAGVDLEFYMPLGGVTYYDEILPNGTVTCQTAEHGSIKVSGTPKPGSNVSIAISPEDGYALDTLKATYASGAEDYTYTNSSSIFSSTALPVSVGIPFDGSDMTVTATFKPKAAQIVTVQGENGSFTVDGLKDYTYKEQTVQGAQGGDTITITAAPESGYVLGGLTIQDNKGGNIEYTADGNRCTFTVPLLKSGVNQIQISAQFVRASYNVTAQAAQGGTITTAVQTAQAGDPVTFTVTPDAGYALAADSVKVNDGAVTVTDNGDGTYTFTMPAGAVEITAAFEKVDYDVTVGTTGNGAVTADVETAQMGDTVTLTVTPDEGYQLAAGSLKVNGGAVTVTDNGDGTYTFTMPASAVEITAAFEKVDYDVMVGTAENGAITADVETAQVGDTVTLTVTPDEGYQLAAGSLKVNDGAVAVTDNGDGTYTFTMPAESVFVEAVFEAVEEPSTDPDEPSTEPEEPSTDPDEPSTEPEEPSTDSNEPSAEPEEPLTEEEPSTDGSDNADTGDAALMAAMGAAILSAGAAIVLVKMKKRS